MRINKYLAQHGGFSRRQADELIESGRVTINGEIARLGAQVRDNDLIEVDHQALVAKESFTYLIFHKPVGYVSSRRSQGGVPTIYEVLPSQYEALKPVGRLDKNTSGLLLLTDDGDFAHQMTHPKFYKQKTYHVSLDQPLQPLHRQMINDFGVMLEDGKSQFQIQRSGEDDYTWQLVLHEGRNRQIRRTFSALGYTVKTLHRTSFGRYNLDDLASGAYSLVKP